MAEQTISSLGVKNWTVDRLPDLTGKHYVITGGNSGIGLKAAFMLGERGADLTLACRSPHKAEAARGALRQKVKGEVEVVGLDLSDLASIRAGADLVRGLSTGIDGLINNAGIMQTPQLRTKDGFELQFGTNHLGHFLWTSLLFDLVEARAGRIVTLASIAHKFGAMKFDDLMHEEGYSPMTVYAQSKLSNLLFAFELHKRLTARGSKVQSIACHPGYSATNLQSTGPRGFFNFLYKPMNALMAQPAHLGAVPTVLAAAGTEAKAGAYYGPTGFYDMRGPVSDAKVADQALRQEDWKRLWDESERLLGVSFLSD